MMRMSKTKTNNRNEDSIVRPGKMIVSKNKLSTRVNRMIILILFAFGLFSAVVPAFAQPSPADLSSIRNNNAPSDIRGTQHLRNKHAKAFADADRVVNQESVGPGMVTHSTSGPV